MGRPADKAAVFPHCCSAMEPGRPLFQRNFQGVMAVKARTWGMYCTCRVSRTRGGRAVLSTGSHPGADAAFHFSAAVIEKPGDFSGLPPSLAASPQLGAPPWVEVHDSLSGTTWAWRRIQAVTSELDRGLKVTALRTSRTEDFGRPGTDGTWGSPQVLGSPVCEVAPCLGLGMGNLEVVSRRLPT